MPLDANSPQDRLTFMIGDAQIAVLIIQECQRIALPPLTLPIISIDSDWLSIDTTYSQKLVQATTTENLAYIIYTSGSTGMPKGVMGTHKAMLNRFDWMWRAYPFEQHEICCQKTSLNFVDSIWEIFGPLLKGCPIMVIAENVVKDLAQFVARLAENNITRLVLVPSLLRVMLEVYPDLGKKLPALQCWTCSGEALSRDLLSQFAHCLSGRRLLNLYGSSEVAADVTWHIATDDRTDSVWVPIGRPIDNIHAYILDAHLQLVPPGVVGELYIGGPGLARGYFHQPALTAERFVPHSFSVEPGARLYRMGDLVRYHYDGILEYLGRNDQQVKIHGIRIELGEIESVLKHYGQVREAVVVAREDTSGSKRLVAYLVVDKETICDITTLRAYMRMTLPEYMIPTAFVFLDALPLLPGGKVDRRSLPSPDQSGSNLSTGYGAPRDAIEMQLAHLFQDILQLPAVSIRDNFFELGGHSLLAVRLVSQIQKQFAIDLPLTILFQAATIEYLATCIRQQAHSVPWSPAVLLQSGVSKQPLFCVHPAGGNVFCYTELARYWGKARSFYGLQALGMEQGQEPYWHIEEMAACSHCLI